MSLVFLLLASTIPPHRGGGGGGEWAILIRNWCVSMMTYHLETLEGLYLRGGKTQKAKDQRNVDGKLSGVVVSKAENPSSMKISVPSLWKQGFWLCKQRPRIVIAV